MKKLSHLGVLFPGDSNLCHFDKNLIRTHRKLWGRGKGREREAVLKYEKVVLDFEKVE